MRTTIDAAGRIVIPKALRDEARLRAGCEVEINLRDGRLEIELPTIDMRLAAGKSGARIEADAELPPLTTEEVREVLERTRR
jgi:AbrB family looped-hinge helix DNA binding protein